MRGIHGICGTDDDLLLVARQKHVTFDHVVLPLPNEGLREEDGEGETGRGHTFRSRVAPTPRRKARHSQEGEGGERKRRPQAIDFGGGRGLLRHQVHAKLPGAGLGFSACGAAQPVRPWREEAGCAQGDAVMEGATTT